MPEMKRVTTLTVLVASAWAAVGCQPAGDAGGGHSQASHPPKIALIMKSLANDFFATMADGARRHQALHAAQYELSVTGIKNETDLTEQVNLIEQAVAQGATAIVIAPADSKALVPALKRAQQRGAVIVNIDNRLDEEVVRQAGLQVSFVGPDNRDGARRVGHALAAKLTWVAKARHRADFVLKGQSAARRLGGNTRSSAVSYSNRMCGRLA